MWEKIKGAARLAWIIIQIISIPMAVVGTLFLIGVFPFKRNSTGTGDNGNGASEVGDNLDRATDAKQRIETISGRFDSLLAEGRDIIAGIRNRGTDVGKEP